MKTQSKVRLERDVVVRTAMDLVDREGLETLTIRRLARDLGVTPMALYWHFEDKQALLDALSDQLWSDAYAHFPSPGGPDDGDVWAEIRGVIDALVAVFRLHPNLAAFAPTRVTECDAGLVITEWTLERLHRVGLGPERASEVAWFLLSATVMLVTNQPGVGYPDEIVRDEVKRTKQARLLTLPPERFPHIVAATPYLVACEAPELYYDLGVDLIVGGVKVATSVPSS